MVWVMSMMAVDLLKILFELGVWFSEAGVFQHFWCDHHNIPTHLFELCILASNLFPRLFTGVSVRYIGMSFPDVLVPFGSRLAEIESCPAEEEGVYCTYTR
jgi:hypothetical protein